MSTGTAVLKTRPNTADSLAWSDDNQLAVTTLSFVFLLTPHQAEDSFEYHRTSISNPSGNNKDSAFLKLLLLAEDEDIKAVQVWKDGFNQAVWSPSGFSDLGGCLLATVSTLYSVIIWQPNADPAISSWEQLQDLSALYRAELSGDRGLDELTVEELNQLSIKSIAWSPCCPSPDKEPFGIIALGAKDGSVSLWRFSNQKGVSISRVALETVQSGWVSRLSWSSWQTMDDGQISSYLTVASADGTVSVWQVIIDLENMFSCTMRLVSALHKNDGRTVTLVQTQRGMTDRECVAICKGRTLTIWFPPAAKDLMATSEGRTLSLAFPKIMSIAGVVWGMDASEMRVFTVDGRCFTVSTIKEGAAERLGIIDESTDDLYEDLLQLGSNDNADGEEDAAEDNDAEESQPRQGQQIRIFGAASSANGLFDAVVFHTASPNDFVYHTANRLISFVTVRPVYAQGVEDFEKDLIVQLSKLLRLPDTLTSHSSSYILWDIIQYCLADIAQWSQPGDTFTSLAQKAFNEFCDSYDDSHLIREWRNVSARAPSADDAVLNGYRKALFGNPKINVLRLQDYFIGHLLAQAKSISKEITASLRASQLSVRHRLTAYYLSQTMHLLKAYVSNTDTLTDHDTTQIGLLTDAYATLCLSKSHDESTLSAFADCCTQLRNRATPLYPDDLERALVSGGGTGSEALPAREACVACGEMVGLAGIERGVCAAGHVWTRCSATISTLGAVGLRTCTGCGRKLAAPNQPSELANLVLQQIAHCLYCGNRFAEHEKLLDR